MSITKLRKWDDTYLRNRFNLADEQTLNAAPMPESLFIAKDFLSNLALYPAKLQKSLQANHPAYVTKTIAYFNNTKNWWRKQKNSFVGVKETDKNQLLISYRLWYLVLKQKTVYLGKESCSTSIANCSRAAF